MSEPVKIILDTDPGIDDALALMYAVASRRFDILAVTGVFGNVTTEIAATNALWLTRWLGISPPVARGCAEPVTDRLHVPSAHVHGDFGFGELGERFVTEKPVAVDAAQLMIDLAAADPGAITLVALGPLANVATALDRDAAFARNIREIVIMGGACRVKGNITPHAEANIYNDPEAAEIVFASGAPVRLVGLDVTDKIQLDHATISRIVANAGQYGDFIRQITDFYLRFYASRGFVAGASLHDPVTLIALLHPEWFTWQRGSVSTVRGGLESGNTILTDGDGPVQAALAADTGRILAEFETVMAQLADLPPRTA